MHTSNMAKMTNEHVLLTDSGQHHLALLQWWFRHQDELKWIWCNGMKWITRWDKQFDILHTQNGAMDAEIRHDEQGMMMSKYTGLSSFLKKKQMSALKLKHAWAIDRAGQGLTWWARPCQWRGKVGRSRGRRQSERLEDAGSGAPLAGSGALQISSTTRNLVPRFKR